LKQHGNISFYSLLEKSGYFEMRQQITIEAIRETLLGHLDYVNDWMQYSEDERCDPVWFLRQNGAYYELGFWSSKSGVTTRQKYSDPFEACAVLIKHMIE